MAFTLSSNDSLGITTSISPQVFAPNFTIPEGTITFGTHIYG